MTPKVVPTSMSADSFGILEKKLVFTANGSVLP